MAFLRQVRVIDPVHNLDQSMDVRLDNNRIGAIAAHLPSSEGDQSIDAAHLIFAPALIDLYSCCGEPGYEERETLATMHQAAIAGGFGQVNLLPNTSPAIDNPATVSWLAQQLPAVGPQVLKPWGAITVDTKGAQLTELGELAQSGIVGFADGKAITDIGLLRRMLEYAAPIDKPIMLWANDPVLAGGGIAREGVEALRFGLSGNPVYSETAPLGAILELVAEIGTPIHLMRLSTARGVELIQRAKQGGLPITASVTWLHLLYSTSDLAGYDPNLRLSPPLGNETDRQALIEAVKTGVIDAIAVDHQAYTYEEKTVAFGEAPTGALGLEFVLPMLWQKLVVPGQLSGLQLWKALSQGPAYCIQQAIDPMQPEIMGYVLFDPAVTWTVGDLQSRSRNTHLLNQMIQGKVLQLFA
jgi:dihydroorotase